jgi:hypothetical protein
MKPVFKLTLLSVSLFALAFSSQGHDQTLLRQEGQLLSVRLALGDPLRIFVVGREEAKIDLSNLEVTVRRLKPYPGQVLQAEQDGDHFFVPKNLELQKATDIEVKTKMKNVSETMQFKLDKKLY